MSYLNRDGERQSETEKRGILDSSHRDNEVWRGRRVSKTAYKKNRAATAEQSKSAAKQSSRTGAANTFTDGCYADARAGKN